MKILLTGGAGFIATHTCVELMAAGHDVVVVDNYVNSQPEALRRVEEIAGRPVKAYEADVCDRAAMDKIFSENRFDAVIHFAGLKAVGESVHKPLEYYRNNLDSTLTLCETMRRYGCKRIVFSSSATVYGVPDETWGEHVKASVVLMPGSRLTAEALRQYCRAHMPTFRAPKEIEIVPELPKGATGKVLTAVLRARSVQAS